MRLLSLMGVGSSTRQDAACMLVLGMGIGGVMRVLVIIVQNGVPHSELGWRPPVPRRLQPVSQPAPGGEIPAEPLPIGHIG